MLHLEHDRRFFQIAGLAVQPYMAIPATSVRPFACRFHNVQHLLQHECSSLIYSNCMAVH